MLCHQHSFPPAHPFHLHGSYKAGAISVSPAAAIAALSGSIPTPMVQDAFPNPVLIHMDKDLWTRVGALSSTWWDPAAPFQRRLGHEAGFSGIADLLYPPVYGEWRKPNISGLGICWTVFQLCMKTILFADHKLLDHPQMCLSLLWTSLHSTAPGQAASSHHPHPQPHPQLSPAPVTALERTPALQRHLCLHDFILTDINVASGGVTVSDNKPLWTPTFKQPSRVSYTWPLADPHRVIKLTQRDCNTCTAH